MRFARTAGKHGVPRHSAWYVTMTARPVPIVTNWGELGLWYEGIDDRGVTLEIATVTRKGTEWIFHAMPADQRPDSEVN